jgi:hypothetical protein
MIYNKKAGHEPCFFIIPSRREDIAFFLPCQPVTQSTHHFFSPGMIMGPHMGSAQFLPLSSSRVINSRFRSLLLISFLRMECLLHRQDCFPVLRDQATLRAEMSQSARL